MKAKIVSAFKTVTKFEKRYKLIGRISLCLLFVSNYYLRKNDKEQNLELLNVKIKYAKLEKENLALKVDLVTYNRTYETFPFPIWQKKKTAKGFVLQYINPEYEKVFGGAFDYNRYRVLGKNNFQLGYPEDIAKHYFDNDMQVSLTGNILKIKEPFKSDSDIDFVLDVVKWREIRDKDTLVNGMVTDIKKKR